MIESTRRSVSAVRSLATSGITFYTGDRFPQWKGNAFIGAMVEGRTSGTGRVRRITFNEKGQPIQREPILAELLSAFVTCVRGRMVISTC